LSFSDANQPPPLLLKSSSSKEEKPLTRAGGHFVEVAKNWERL
jgi:hypothetical protein